MDFVSIGAGCQLATTTIAKTSPALRLFVREVREARPELDAVLAELHSLDGVLDMLNDDAACFPPDLAARTPSLLRHCTSIIEQIAGYMHVCNGLGLTKRDKKFRWLAIRADMVKLRLTLEGYKSILAVVTDLVGLNKSRKDNDALSIHSDSTNYHVTLEAQLTTNDDIRSELTHVTADMGTLRGRLQGDFRSNYAVADLESYLDAMQRDATNLGHRMNMGCFHSSNGENKSIDVAPALPGKSPDRDSSSHGGGGTACCSSVGDEPDSAIDVNDGPPSPYQPSPTADKRPERDDLPVPPGARVSSMHIVEIDEFLHQLGHGQAEPTRPPTPPPKARARGLVLGATLPDHHTVLASPHAQTRPASVRSGSDYSTMPPPDRDSALLVPRRSDSIDSKAESTLGSMRAFRQHHHQVAFPAHGRHASINFSRTTPSPPTFSAAAPPPALDAPDRYGSPAENRSGLFGRSRSFSVAGQSTRAPETPDGVPRRGATHSRSVSLLATSSAQQSTPPSLVTLPPRPAPPPPRPAHDRKASIVSTTPTIATSSSGGNKTPRKSATTGSSIRSNSSRISSVLSRMTSWRPHHKSKEAPPPLEEAEPDDIFGVSLKKSMQIACAAARTHHDGSKGSSRRSFPRCVFSCALFIKNNDGVRAPHVFGGGVGGGGGEFPLGDANDDDDAAHHHHLMRVAALKEAFSTAPAYGDDGTIDWARFSVHDAAELIVLFLQQLPKPLVSEAVAKRWIVLSRQATLPGSLGLRLDACIDFWDEALLGVRGPARSLFKLLLNLWGDIADAADVNDMTAERLAARLLGPLMHLPAGKFTTDYMLGLAFLIRKRSEYAIMLRDGRKSKAAF